MNTIITIATSNYIENTELLVNSIRKNCKNCELVIFCDNVKKFSRMESNKCKLVELDMINRSGVKRSKFLAYSLALESGDFLYLDSDIVVIDDISEIFRNKKFTGCFDDLGACPFIENKLFPWKNDPNLVNKKYINSGVFFAPKTMKNFFEILKFDSLIDSIWNKYIFDGKLYDNHFLCAYLNKYNININYIDEDAYNWQGFFRDSKLQVNLIDNELRNISNGKKLKIVHFAGMGTSSEMLNKIPADISNFLRGKA